MVLASSVLPVPVGPAKNITPLGFMPEECCKPLRPVIARVNTSMAFSMAVSCPFTRFSIRAFPSVKPSSPSFFQGFSRMPNLNKSITSQKSRMEYRSFLQSLRRPFSSIKLIPSVRATKRSCSFSSSSGCSWQNAFSCSQTSFAKNVEKWSPFIKFARSSLLGVETVIVLQFGF